MKTSDIRQFTICLVSTYYVPEITLGLEATKLDTIGTSKI